MLFLSFQSSGSEGLEDQRESFSASTMRCRVQMTRIECGENMTDTYTRISILHKTREAEVLSWQLIPFWGSRCEGDKPLLLAENSHCCTSTDSLAF
jgi:hypothetical protein